jgi:hypothetical protein
MTADLAVDQPPRQVPCFALHPIRGVVWATFFGSPISGGIVLAINFARLGRRAAAWTTVLLAAAATTALFAVAFAIPDDVRVPNAAYWLPQLVVMYLVAVCTQGGAIDRHTLQGGHLASAWWSVGIGLLCLPVVLAGIFGAALLLDPSQDFGTRVVIGGDEVYYAGEATEDDARYLGEKLRECGFFTSQGSSVRIEATAGKYAVSFVLVRDAWHNAQVVGGLRMIGETLSESRLGVPLTIRLCDDSLEPQKTLTIP